MKPRITMLTLGVDDLERSVYFQDPDGHLWEVAWNPAFLSED